MSDALRVIPSLGRKEGLKQQFVEVCHAITSCSDCRLPQRPVVIAVLLIADGLEHKVTG